MFTDLRRMERVTASRHARAVHQRRIPRRGAEIGTSGPRVVRDIAGYCRIFADELQSSQMIQDVAAGTATGRRRRRPTTRADGCR